jgi:hypothetical protein
MDEGRTGVTGGPRRPGWSQPAMIVMGALCVAAALVTAVFVSDQRARRHRIVARAPEAGYAEPIKTQEVTS